MELSKLPIKTIIVCGAVIAVIFSPLPRNIYNDWKSEKQDDIDKAEAEAKVAEREELKAKFREVIKHEDLSLPGIKNQKVTIGYKLTSNDEVRYKFWIAPYTKYKGDEGSYIVNLLDADGFRIKEMEVYENEMSNLLDEVGQIEGGLYEGVMHIDLSDLSRVETITIGTRLSQRRQDKLSGAYENSFLKATKEEIERMKQLQQVASAKGWKLYTVKSGDSMWRVATKHGISVKQLVDANEGKSVLKVGDVIAIPKPNK